MGLWPQPVLGTALETSIPELFYILGRGWDTFSELSCLTLLDPDSLGQSPLPHLCIAALFDSWDTVDHKALGL